MEYIRDQEGRIRGHISVKASGHKELYDENGTYQGHENEEGETFDRNCTYVGKHMLVTLLED